MNIYLTTIIHEIIFMQIRGIVFRRHIFIFQGIREEKFKRHPNFGDFILL